ncbi:NACHT domain-containing protein [Kordia sp.]|uniref:NACHT domain-containing protein n=1 Tax=Kordia sp. TaxID=1965332 RepID=UPI003B5AC9AA
MNNARNYLVSDIKKLFALTGNQCSAPNCNRPIIAEDGNTVVGKICHIEAASPNGPRYRLDMTNDERRAYDNLLILCDEHHMIIDNRRNDGEYPVELLKKWRDDHISLNELKRNISQEDLEKIIHNFYVFSLEDYLKENLHNKDFKNIDRVYVELFGEEGYNDIEVVGLEKINEYDLLRDILKPTDLDVFEDENEDEAEDSEAYDERRVDSILTIINDTPHVHIIGNPGSGKSTTFQKILYNNSLKILEGDTSIKIPFLLEAKDFGQNKSFKQMLYEQASEEWINTALTQGKLHILIDGLNEIDINFDTEAYEELLDILSTYPDNHFVLSERKKNYKNRFKIPVFELKELNEKQIKKFIDNHINTNKIKLWNELENNVAMMDLAYNPLTLRMIISVVKQNKKIPANKGSLFNLFINSLYVLENRKKDKSKIINKETKFDFLCEIAFMMRSQGIVSISLVEFKNLIAQIIPKYNSKYAVNHMYNELIDNIVVKINANENVSFFHETYQEFFTAIFLKNTYVIHKKLDIDVIDIKWFEAILMCSDLLNTNDLYIPFFKYLFAGQDEKKSTIVITDNKIDTTTLTENHFNKYILLPCKIAYFSKSYRPEMYALAETYMYNTLLLWKYSYIKNKKMILPLDVIFGAISSLDSDKLINYVFKNLWWIYNWFFAEYEEENNHFSSNITPLREIETEKQGTDLIIFNAIATHTPNFAKFYSAIDEAIETYEFSRSIFWRFKRMRVAILKERSENELIKALEKKWDFFVFSNLLRINLDEIERYHFEDHPKKENDFIVRTILRNHIKQELAQAIVIREIKKGAYKAKFIQKVFKAFLYFELYDSFFELLWYVKEHYPELYEQHFPFVQKYPYRLLPERFQNLFSHLTTTSSIPFELTEEPNTMCIERKYIDYVKQSQGIFTINDTLEIETKTINELIVTITGKCELVLKHPKFKAPLLDDIPTEGTISIKSNSKVTNYQYHSLFSKVLKRGGYGYLLELEDPDNTIEMRWLGTLNEHGYEVQIHTYNELRIASYNRNLKKKDPDKFHLIYRLIHDDEIPQKGILKNHHNYLENTNSTIIYHADSVLSDENWSKLIKRNIQERKTIRFVEDVGLTHAYHTELENVNYGIVVNYVGKFLKYYNFKYANFGSLLMKSMYTNMYQEEDILIIEKNGKVHLVDNEESNLDKIGYIQSKVVAIGNLEGFIKNEESTKDYYFNFKSCNFIPKIGDKVRFLPAKNFYASNENQPIALRITQVDENLN